MNDFYVYEYIRLDTNEPFYIGKGHKNRWRKLDREYNPYFMNIINKIPFVVNILHDNLDEETAFGLEVWYIREYRDIIGYDLCNINDGGEGCVLVGKNNPFYGRRHSEETIEILKKANGGINHPQYGKHQSQETIEKRREKIKGLKRSDESKRKMSKNHANVNGKNNPNSESVICLTTKKIFLTIKDAMNEYNITGNSNIGNCCRGWKMVKGEKRLVKSAGKYNNTPLKWKYLRWNHNKKFRISK